MLLIGLDFRCRFIKLEGGADAGMGLHGLTDGCTDGFAGVLRAVNEGQF